MMRKAAAFTALLIFSPILVSATIINIPADYPTIQQGIDAGADGDTVLVQPGTYYENINFNGHNIMLGSLYLTTGDTSYIAQTVIDGDSAGSVVTFENGEDSSAAVTGFNIRNGYANFGGGIFCQNSSPVLSFNIISFNGSDSGGGGIFCGGSSAPFIMGNSIIENYTDDKGGGIFCNENSYAQISINFISDNSAVRGGGICSYNNSNIIVRDNIIKLNTGYWGGGLLCRSYSAEIENNIIYENTAGSNGGGLYIFRGLVILLNNVITNNTATYQGGGIGCDPTPFVSMKNCIVWGNNAQENSEIMGNNRLYITYSDIGEGWIGQGNIDVDPMFRDPENENYHLMALACGDSANSPCIDAGDPEIFDAFLDCQGGLGSDTSDIGGYSGGAPSTYVGRILNVPSPYGTIQHAINVSRSRDTVLVQPGTYTETIEILGKNIVIGSMYIITGNPDYISTTIIDGNNQNSVVSFYNTGEGDAAIIGFTITHGNAQEYGGGINCFYSSPLIKSNIIRDNSAMGYYMEPKFGGGISCVYYSHAKIINNLITGDTADIGGGINISRSNPLIDGNVISNNLASDLWQFGSGGGIRIIGNPVICNNMVMNNEANHNGGGVSSTSGSGGIYHNNIFHENNAWSLGGGMYLNNSDPCLFNNIFFENTTNGSGGGIYAFSSSSTLINNIIWQDSAYNENEIYASQCSLSVSYCNIEDTLWPGEGNISVDPLFRAAGFHLQSTACGDPHDSPCIDAGDPNILDSLLDCSWGLGSLRSDMGAYGGGDSAIVGIPDASPLPDRYLTIKNYPNPFNQNTTIRFDLPVYCYTTIDIYDVLGRDVENLLSEIKPPGSYSIKWEARNRASGIYFYRLKACDYTRIGKMVLLR